MFEDYLEAKKIGDRQFRQDINEKRDPYLPALDDLLKNPLTAESEPVGNIEIPLPLVIGTKTRTRANSFASNFMPIADRKSEFAYKWASLYEYQTESGITDPVKAYEYLGKFYIEEGNKRVSVMKYLGNPSIYGNVTRILPERNSETEVYYEFLEFYKVAPLYEFNFSRKGSYQRLARMIGQNMTDKWPEDLLRSLQGAYFRFYRVFYANGGQNLDFSASDAFLKYLSIYSFDSILDVSGALLENRIHNIWNELVVEANPEESIVVNQDIEQKHILLSLFNHTQSYSEDNPLKVVFLYGETPEKSWHDNNHDLGRKAMEHAMNGLIETAAYDDCLTEEAIRRDVKDASDRGAKVIFATSPAQFNTIVRCATEYRNIIFFNFVINSGSNLVRTYYDRNIEVKYLLGILAAQSAKNHQIAYLAEYPLYGTVANLNAFAQGAAFIDPEAEIHVFWKGEDWKKKAGEMDIRIISGLDAAGAAESGVFLWENESVTSLGSAVTNWGKYYERIVRPIANGTFDYSVGSDQSMFLWWGMSEGITDIRLSPEVSYYTRKTILNCREALRKGVLTPFWGELRSQKSVIRRERSGRLSDRSIISMNWLNDNVVGRLPEYEELDEKGKALFEICGIAGEEEA